MSAQQRRQRMDELFDEADRAARDRALAGKRCDDAEAAYHRALVAGDAAAASAADERYKEAAAQRNEAERRHEAAWRQVEGLNPSVDELADARTRADSRRPPGWWPGTETHGGGEPGGDPSGPVPSGGQPPDPERQARNTSPAAGERDLAAGRAQQAGTDAVAAEGGNRPEDAAAARPREAAQQATEQRASAPSPDEGEPAASRASLAGEQPGGGSAPADDGTAASSSAAPGDAALGAEQAAPHAGENAAVSEAAAPAAGSRTGDLREEDFYTDGQPTPGGLSPPRPGEPGIEAGIAGYAEGTDDLGEYREPVDDEAFAQGARDWQRHGEIPDPDHWTSQPYGEMTANQKAACDAAERDIRQGGWGEHIDDVRPSVRRNLMEQHLAAIAGGGVTAPGLPAGGSVNGSQSDNGGNGMPTGTSPAGTGPTGELAGDSKYRAAQAAMAAFEAEAARYEQAAETLEAGLTAVEFDRDPALMGHIRSLRETAAQIRAHTSGGKAALGAHQTGAEYHETGHDANAAAFRPS